MNSTLANRSETGSFSRSKNHRPLFVLIFLYAMFFLVSKPSFADTIVPGGNISSNITWTSAGSPYIVQGSITVSSGTLTIEPGVVVKAEPNANVEIRTSGGKLFAEGTLEEPILFTSNSANPSPGEWKGIFFDGGTATDSSLKHCTIAYAQNGIRISQNVFMFVQNTTFQNNSSVAVSAPTLKETRNFGSGNTYIGNGRDAIEWTATLTATVDQDMTLASQGVPYIANGSINVARFVGLSTMTVQPGVEIRFKPNQNLKFEVGGGGWQGRVLFQGSQAQPIRLTVDSQNPTPGSWQGIRFDTGAQPGFILDYVIFEYAGAPAVSVPQDLGFYTISHSTIRHSSGIGVSLRGNGALQNNIIENNGGQGIEILSGSPSILSNTVQQNASTGLLMQSNAGTPLIDDNHFLNNGSRAANIYSLRQIRNMTQNNTFSGITNPICQCIEFMNTAPTLINYDTTLYDFTYPYVFNGSIQVYREVPPHSTLTIQPGTELKFKPGQNLILGIGYRPNQYVGALVALGDDQNPIRFSSAAAVPAPGDWQGLKLEGFMIPDQMSNVIVEHAGNAGITVWDTHLEINNSTIQNNSGDGMQIVGSGQLDVKNTSFLSNGLKAINHTGSSGAVLAPLNWFGSSNEPSAQVSGSVQYEPWLISAPTTPFQWTAANLSSKQFNPDESSATFQFSHPEAANWMLEILNSDLSQVLKTIKGQGPNPSIIEWNGNDDSKEFLPDGMYKYRFSGSSQITSQQAAPALGNIQLNNALPAAEIILPTASQIIPGHTIVQIQGTAQGKGFTNYTVERFDTFQQNNFVQIAASTSPVSDGVLANWDTGNLANPIFKTLRLSVNNNASHTAFVEIPVTIFNIFNIASSQGFISPNGDGLFESTTISANSTLTADWLLQIKNSVNQVVRTVNAANESFFSFEWNGKDDSNVLLPDGVYTYHFTITEPDSGVNVPAQQGPSVIVIDTTVPQLAISDPQIDQVVFGLSFPVIGTVSDLNILSYKMFYANAENPNNFIQFANGSSNVNNSLLGVWTNLINLTNGGYIIQLQATDRGGNTAEIFVPVQLDNITITNVDRAPLFFDPLNSETTQISYAINHDAFITIRIFTETNGQLVRTLVNQAPKKAGTNFDVWDGRNNSNQPIPYEAYYFRIDAESQAGEGRHGQFVDVFGGSPGPNDFEVNLQNLDFNPYQNEELLIQYPVHAPGRQLVEIRQGNTATRLRLIVENEPKIQGLRTDRWDGRDDNGNIYSGSYHLFFGIAVPFRSKTIILKNTLPAPDNLLSEPYLIIPAYAGVSSLQYDLSEESGVTVIVKDSLGNYVRTLLDQVVQAAGNYSVLWDGKNDLGEFISGTGNYYFYVQAARSGSSESVQAIGNIRVQN